MIELNTETQVPTEVTCVLRFWMVRALFGST